jgi:hypothetical protein
MLGLTLNPFFPFFSLQKHSKMPAISRQYQTNLNMKFTPNDVRTESDAEQKSSSRLLYDGFSSLIRKHRFLLPKKNKRKTQDISARHKAKTTNAVLQCV